MLFKYYVTVFTILSYVINRKSTKVRHVNNNYYG